MPCFPNFFMRSIINATESIDSAVAASSGITTPNSSSMKANNRIRLNESTKPEEINAVSRLIICCLSFDSSVRIKSAILSLVFSKGPNHLSVVSCFGIGPEYGTEKNIGADLTKIINSSERVTSYLPGDINYLIPPRHLSHFLRTMMSSKYLLNDDRGGSVGAQRGLEKDWPDHFIEAVQ